MPSPFDVDPLEHRGHDVGPLAAFFVFIRRRRADDPYGPEPLPRDDDRADDDEVGS